MDKVDKIKVDKLIHKIGLKYNLPDHIVRNIVNSQFEFSAETLRNINFEELDTDEKVEKLKNVFLYKTFGKLYINQLGLQKFLNKKQWKK